MYFMRNHYTEADLQLNDSLFFFEHVELKKPGE